MEIAKRKGEEAIQIRKAYIAPIRKGRQGETPGCVVAKL
jgi:hypothetical protein